MRPGTSGTVVTTVNSAWNLDDNTSNDLFVERGQCYTTSRDEYNKNTTTLNTAPTLNKTRTRININQETWDEDEIRTPGAQFYRSLKVFHFGKS